MAWKLERWLEEIFPGEDKIYSEYRLLPRRKLAIVAAAVIDSALAQLLHMRLKDDAKECEDFLGVSGDSRAPCASFGARIQMAYLIGLITKDDVVILRLIKNIRNAFAHRVRADFNSKDVLPLISSLNAHYRAHMKRLIAAGHLKGQLKSEDVIGAYLAKTPEAGAGLLLAVFTTYHAYLHRLSSRVSRIDDCIKKKAG
jgi:hypothetical protein